MSWFSDDFYEPIMAGSIDGTDTIPHDHGIVRALEAKYRPEKDSKIQGDPLKTLFVGRLNWETTEETLQQVFGRFGKISHLRLVRDVVTGMSRGYAFITYEHADDFKEAYFRTNHMNIDGKQILVDFERERVCKGWIPRRFGGGLGGRKESGQLRFGGRDRPFKKPFTQEIPSFAVKRFDERRGIDRFVSRKRHSRSRSSERRRHSRSRSSERRRERREHKAERERSERREKKSETRSSHYDRRHSSERRASSRDRKRSSDESSRSSSHRHYAEKRSRREHRHSRDD